MRNEVSGLKIDFRHINFSLVREIERKLCGTPVVKVGYDIAKRGKHSGVKT